MFQQIQNWCTISQLNLQQKLVQKFSNFYFDHFWSEKISKRPVFGTKNSSKIQLKTVLNSISKKDSMKGRSRKQNYSEPNAYKSHSGIDPGF